MNVLVTVAIASYNNAPYIKRCIESVLAQTYQNLEILIVDDGSKDNSLEIVEKYKDDSRVRIVSKENGGLSTVRQFSIDHAKGEFVCFIDADDYLQDNYVEVMLKKLLADNSDVCVCSTRFENKDSSYIENASLFWKNIDSLTPYRSTPSFLSGIDGHEYNNLHLSDSWNKMYRLSSIRNSGVKFCMPKELNGSDSLFNLLLALH